MAFETLAKAGNDRRVALKIFDVDRRQEIGVHQLAFIDESGPAFSPDGSMIAMAGTTGRNSPDGNLIATGVTGLKIIDIGKKESATIRRAFVTNICYSTDGRGIVGTTSYGGIGVFDPAARLCSTRFETDVSLDRTIALAPNGRTIVASSEGLVLHAWDLGTRRDRFSVPEAHEGPVNCLLISPDGKTAITGGDDRTLRLWDLATGRQTRVLRISGSVNAAALSPSGRWLAAATYHDHQVFIWDLEGKGDPIVLATRRDPRLIDPLAARFIDENRLVVIDNTVGLYEIDVKRRRVHSGVKIELPPRDPELPTLGYVQIDNAVFLPDGKRIAVNRVLAGVVMANLSTGKSVAELGDGRLITASPEGRLLAVSVPSPDGLRHLMRASHLTEPEATFDRESSGGVIRLVDTTTGKEQHAMTVEGSEVWAMAFSPDGKTLAATSGWDAGQIHLYDVATGKETHTIDGPTFRSPALAFTPDGSRLVTGMADGSVLVWDLKAGR